MYKLFFTLVFVLSFTSIHAQAQDPQVEINALTQRVDSLEHDLTYLELCNKLSELDSDIKILTNEVTIKALGIKIDLFHNNVSSKLGSVYPSLYEGYQSNAESTKELIIKTATYCILKASVSNFTPSEKDYLESKIDILNTHFKSLEGSLKVFKIVMDEYTKRCK